MKIFKKLLLKLGYIHRDDIDLFAPPVNIIQYPMGNVIILKSQYEVPLSAIEHIKDTNTLLEMAKWEVEKRLYDEIKPFIEYSKIHGQDNTIRATITVIKNR